MAAGYATKYLFMRHGKQPGFLNWGALHHEAAGPFRYPDLDLRIYSLMLI